MKLLLALAGVAMVLGGEVQNLRGEPKAVKEEVPEAAPKAAEAGGEVGAVAKEPAEAKAAITKEEQSEEVPKAAGDVVTEPTESKAEASAAAQELESRTETEETEETQIKVSEKLWTDIQQLKILKQVNICYICSGISHYIFTAGMVTVHQYILYQILSSHFTESHPCLCVVVISKEPEVGVVFEELDEKSGDEVKEKSAHRPGRS